MPGQIYQREGNSIQNKATNNEKFTTQQAAAEIIQKLNTITIVLVVLLAMNAYSFIKKK